jgi:hypothetical protein
VFGPESRTRKHLRCFARDGARVVKLRSHTVGASRSMRCAVRLRWVKIVPAERAVEVVAELLQAKSVPPGLTCKALAIDGPGGAGKSTLAARVSEELGGVAIVHTDDFASWENQFDWYRRLLDQLLRPLAEGQPVRYQRFDWERNVLAEWHEVPAFPLPDSGGSQCFARSVQTVSHGERLDTHRPGREASPRPRARRRGSSAGMAAMDGRGRRLHRS